jgi:succinyl-CoA synthetase alpha subunit
VAILVDKDTRLVVQGITGREGSFHATRNRDYGTAVVAGVTPGKSGQEVSGIPVFDTVADAVSEAGANTSMIFVPARFAPDAIYEAVDAGIKTVIIPDENAKDLTEIPDELKNLLDIRTVSRMEEVLKIAFTRLPQPIVWEEETVEEAQVVPPKDETHPGVTAH